MEAVGEHVPTKAFVPMQPVAVYSPHPLQPARDRELVKAQFLPEENLWAYLERTGLRERIGHRPVVVSIDGMRVPRNVWRFCRPKPGTLIEVRAVVKGGGRGGKNPIKTVLSLALLVAAPFAAGALVGATSGLMFGAAEIGFSVLGQMAVNSLFAPPARR